MKNIVRKYLENWWLPICCNLLPLLTFLLGNIFQRDWIIDVSLTVSVLNIIGTFISSVILIINKKWYYSIPQIGITVALFLMVSFYFLFSPPDYYGSDKVIPAAIDIYKPIEGTPTHKELQMYDLVLATSFQSGIYNYYTDYKPKEPGYFYIKAFEISSKDTLSENRVRNPLKVKVENLDHKIYSGEFIIYEGSYDDTYGSRIELWFEPANGGKEYKVTERNYVIEGWTK